MRYSHSVSTSSDQNVYDEVHHLHRCNLPSHLRLPLVQTRVIIIIIIITDEYDLGGTVALLLQDHLTMLIVSHVTTNQNFQFHDSSECQYWSKHTRTIFCLPLGMIPLRRFSATEN